MNQLRLPPKKATTRTKWRSSQRCGDLQMNESRRRHPGRCLWEEGWMMIGVRTAFLFGVLASTALAQTPAASQSDREAPVAPPIVRSLDLSVIDKNVDPCS